MKLSRRQLVGGASLIGLAGCDNVPDSIKLIPGDPLRAWYFRPVTFVRIFPEPGPREPRRFATFTDVRIFRESRWSASWRLDYGEYYQHTILRTLEAKEIEIALPSSKVVIMGNNPLRGVYMSPVNYLARVGNRVAWYRTEEPSVVRRSLEEPWLLESVALRKQVGSVPEELHLGFPF